MDDEADRQVERGQHVEHVDARRVETDFFLGLSQRRGDWSGVLGVLGPAGKGRLAGMAAQGRGPLDQQQVGAVPSLAEQDEHGARRPPRAAGGSG